MLSMFSASVSDYHVSKKRGLDIYVSEGTAVTVDGERMVKLGHGAIVPIVGWHETREAALSSAADVVQVYAARLVEQAEALRRGTDYAI